MWLTALLNDAVQSKGGLFSKAIMIFIVPPNILDKITVRTTVKFSDKERFDKEQIGVKVPFPATNLSIYFIRIRNIWS